MPHSPRITSVPWRRTLASSKYKIFSTSRHRRINHEYLTMLGSLSPIRKSRYSRNVIVQAELVYSLREKRFSRVHRMNCVKSCNARNDIFSCCMRSSLQNGGMHCLKHTDRVIRGSWKQDGNNNKRLYEIPLEACKEKERTEARVFLYMRVKAVIHT